MKTNQILQHYTEFDFDIQSLTKLVWQTEIGVQ